MLIARRLALIVTLKCTLKCKLCCNCVTMYSNPPIIDKESIFEDMKEIFNIYDRVEWLQFVGGELFLHPEIDEILEESFKYETKFDKIILMTNGTVVPNDKTLAVMMRNRTKFEIHISDYGDLSYNKDKLVAALTELEIPHVVKSFYGDIQYYGGWVDSGDFENRHYSEDQLKYMFENCWQIGMKNLHVYNGELHNCIRSLFANDLKMIDIPQNEYIDLKNKVQSLEEKRRIAEKFNTQPLTACQVCNGFDSKNSKRYPAAEQL